MPCALAQTKAGGVTLATRHRSCGPCICKAAVGVRRVPPAEVSSAGSKASPLVTTVVAVAGAFTGSPELASSPAALPDQTTVAQPVALHVHTYVRTPPGRSV